MPARVPRAAAARQRRSGGDAAAWRVGAAVLPRRARVPPRPALLEVDDRSQLPRLVRAALRTGHLPDPKEHGRRTGRRRGGNDVDAADLAVADLARLVGELYRREHTVLRVSAPISGDAAPDQPGAHEDVFDRECVEDRRRVPLHAGVRLA